MGNEMGNQNVTGIIPAQGATALNATADDHLEHDGEGFRQEKEEEDKTISKNSTVLMASEDEHYPKDGGGKDLSDESASLKQPSEDEILLKQKRSQAEDEEKNLVLDSLPENEDANLIPPGDSKNEDEDEEEQNSIKYDEFFGGIIMEMASNADVLRLDAKVDDESGNSATDDRTDVVVANSDQIMESNDMKSMKEESRLIEDGDLMDTSELVGNVSAESLCHTGILEREKSLSTESIETIFMDAIDTELRSLLKEDDQRAIVESSTSWDANEEGVVMNVISDHEPKKVIVEGNMSDIIQVKADDVSQGKEESLYFEQILQENEIKMIATEGMIQKNNLISLAEKKEGVKLVVQGINSGRVQVKTDDDSQGKEECLGFEQLLHESEIKMIETEERIMKKDNNLSSLAEEERAKEIVEGIKSDRIQVKTADASQGKEESFGFEQLLQGNEIKMIETEGKIQENSLISLAEEEEGVNIVVEGIKSERTQVKTEDVSQQKEESSDFAQLLQESEIKMIETTKEEEKQENNLISSAEEEERVKVIMEGIKIQVNNDDVSQGKEDSLGLAQLLQESEIKIIETEDGKKLENYFISLAEEEERVKVIVEGIKSGRIQIKTDYVNQGKEERLASEQPLQKSDIKMIETEERKKQEHILISLTEEGENVKIKEPIISTPVCHKIEEEDIEHNVATDWCKHEVQSASAFCFSIDSPPEIVIKGVAMEAKLRERTNDIFEKDMVKNKEERTEIVEDKIVDQIEEDTDEAKLVESKSQTLPVQEIFAFNIIQANHELPDCLEETFREEAAEKSEMIINGQELDSSSHVSESLDMCSQMPNLAEEKHSPPELGVIYQDDHELFEFPVEMEHKETAQPSELKNNEENSSSSNASEHLNLVDHKTQDALKDEGSSCKRILIPVSDYEPKEQESSSVVHGSAGINLEASMQCNFERMKLPLYHEKRENDQYFISKKSSDQETLAVMPKSNDEELKQSPVTLKEKPKELNDDRILVKRSDSVKMVMPLHNRMEEECLKEPPEKKKGKQNKRSSFLSCIFCTTAVD